VAARLLDRAKQRIHQEDGTRADERPIGTEGGQGDGFFVVSATLAFGLSLAKCYFFQEIHISHLGKFGTSSTQICL